MFFYIKIDLGTLVIGSVFCAPSEPIEHDLKEWCNHFPDFSKVIIGGDFNAY